MNAGQLTAWFVCAGVSFVQDTEEQFLAQALRESKAEYEARCQEASEEEAKAMQRVMEVSKEEYKKIKKDEDEMQRAIMLSLAEYSKELQRSNSSSDEAITREVTDQASKIPGDGADLSCSDATEQAPSRLLEQKVHLSTNKHCLASPFNCMYCKVPCKVL